MENKTVSAIHLYKLLELAIAPPPSPAPTKKLVPNLKYKSYTIRKIRQKSPSKIEPIQIFLAVVGRVRLAN